MIISPDTTKDKMPRDLNQAKQAYLQELEDQQKAVTDRNAEIKRLKKELAND